MLRKEQAVNLKHSGHNCAQAVMCAFSDVTGMSAEQLNKIGAAFGSGMGSMDATCGALCGAQVLLGMKKYNGKSIGKDAAAVLKSFEKKCGATLCKDLKGRDTGVVLCECDDCVRNAVEIIEPIII